MNGNRRTRFFGRKSPSSPIEIANTIKNIVGNYNNIKGMWCFDKTSGVSIYDLSGNDHTITLRDNTLATIDASTCTPGFSGLAPYLTFDATHVWNTLDHTDFSLTDGAGTDIAGTMIWAGIMVDMTSSVLFAKYTTAGSNIEYFIYLSGGDKFAAYFYKNDASASVARTYNTALTAYQGQFVTFVITYDGSEANGGIKLYFLGTKVDDINSGGGIYAGMTNGTAPLGSYYDAAANPLKGKASFQAFIKGEVLTPAQIKQIDWYLRTWAGQTVSAP